MIPPTATDPTYGSIWRISNRNIRKIKSKRNENEKNVKENKQDSYFLKKPDLNNEILSDRIGMLIVKDLQLISFVENEPFRDLMATTHPGINICRRNMMQ